MTEFTAELLDHMTLPNGNKVVDIDIVLHNEYDHPDSHFHYGDDDESKRQQAEDVAKILADLEWNPWAWCVVEVSATFAGLTGNAFLGACNYDSEEQFRQPGGYFDDMRHNALCDLADKLNAVLTAAANLETQTS